MFRTEIIVVVCLIELVFLIRDILENYQDQRPMIIGKCVGLVIALVIELVPNLVQNKNIYWIIAPAVELVPNLDQDKIIYWILKAIVFWAMFIPPGIPLLYIVLEKLWHITWEKLWHITWEKIWHITGEKIWHIVKKLWHITGEKIWYIVKKIIRYLAKPKNPSSDDEKKTLKDHFGRKKELLDDKKEVLDDKKEVLDDKKEVLDDEKEVLRADLSFKIFSGFWGAQIYFGRFQFMIGILTCIRVILLIFVYGRIIWDQYNAGMIIYVVIESIVAFVYGYVWPYLKKWQKLRYMKHIKNVTKKV